MKESDGEMMVNLPMNHGQNCKNPPAPPKGFPGWKK